MVVVERPVLFDMAAHFHIVVVFVDTVVRFEVYVVVVVADAAAAVFVGSADTFVVVAVVVVVGFAAVVVVYVTSGDGSMTGLDPRCCGSRLNLKLYQKIK